MQKAVHWTAFLFSASEDAQTPEPRFSFGDTGVLDLLHKEPDDYLLSHGQSALSSAWSCFTVLFGMG
ncbi:hypothetical protein AB3X91_30945, partial [Paraburkholderia sp. BR14263]|uniref:hypothetical protein n=1 Tax=unclassified Paraburkholderia TaxID=2615204 RepID=UPI0034CD2B9F